MSVRLPGSQVPSQTSSFLGKWIIMMWCGVPLRTPQEDIMNSHIYNSSALSAKAWFRGPRASEASAWKCEGAGNLPTWSFNKFAQRGPTAWSSTWPGSGRSTPSPNNLQPRLITWHFSDVGRVLMWTFWNVRVFNRSGREMKNGVGLNFKINDAAGVNNVWKSKFITRFLNNVSEEEKSIFSSFLFLLFWALMRHSISGNVEFFILIGQ